MCKCAGSQLRHCRCYFVRHSVQWCGSVTFVWLPFIISAAPNFVSDLDPLVLKAYTPGYVQSQIDLLKRQKKFTTKLVLEKPKLPPKETGEDPSKGGSAQVFLKDRLILYHSKALIQHPQLILLLQQTLFLHPATTQGPEILNQLRSGKLVVVLVLSLLQSTKNKGPTEEMPQNIP